MSGEINTHAFMDSMAGEQQPSTMPTRPLAGKDKIYIQNLARSIMNEYPERKLGGRSTDLNPHTWNVEGYNVAVEKIYSYVLVHKNTEPEWEKEMYELARERVALAGYRLAHII